MPADTENPQGSILLPHMVHLREGVARDLREMRQATRNGFQELVPAIGEARFSLEIWSGD